MQRSEIRVPAVLAIVLVSYTMIVPDISIVITALPKIHYALAFSATALSWVAAEIRRRTPDAQENVTISLLTGYAAFIPADAIGASGPLATVAAGSTWASAPRTSSRRAPACRAASSGRSSTSST